MMNTERRIKRCLKARKRTFTLLELMIVLMILALTLGVVGINVGRAVREQRFRSEVDRVVDKLRLAQELMLIGNVGVDVVFEKVKEGVDFRLEVDGPLTKAWKAEVERPLSPLKAIHWVEFDETVPRVAAPEGRLQLQFLSRGSVMSKGLLRLSTSERDDDFGTLTRYICLSGYPRHIVSEEKAECPLDQIEDIDRALTEWTVDELKEWHARP